MFTTYDITLSPGRDRSLRSFHPWVFSGGIAKKPTCETGSLVKVLSSDGDVLGIGYYNAKTSIAVRMLSFKNGDPKEIISSSIRKAVEGRKNVVSSETNCYRVINAEGDSLPGLVVDLYGDVIVMQVTTLGLEKIKSFLIEEFITVLKPRAIIERSEAAARKEEGLELLTKTHLGENIEPFTVNENGMQLFVDVIEGQKTGFFLDQREMRSLLGSLSRGKSVLNCFAYSGGFSVAAAIGGATEITSVDISEGACTLARKNLLQNGFADENQYPVIAADVFDYLRTDKKSFDVIILDPPAFVKRKENLKAALHGYRDINRVALSKLQPGGMLLTFSCSHYVSEEDFEACVFQAARSAGKTVAILSKHRRALDHPTALAHPEGSYLKGLVLKVLA